MPKEEAEVSLPASSESRRLDVQGLRAVAVTLVVAFHAGLPVPGGFIGVDVFLVISGFVITSMLLRELHGTGSIGLRAFYARRIKRILPALALVTTVVVALSITLGASFGTQQTTAETGLGATYISANIVIYNNSVGYFSPSAETNPLLHTWTLSVEEQVYLVFPTLLLGSWVVGRWLRRRKREEEIPTAVHDTFIGRRTLSASRQSASLMLASISVASFIFSLLVSYGKVSLPTAFAFFHSVTRVWEFAVGAALAMALPRLRSLPRGYAAVLGLGGAVAIGLGAFMIDGEMPYPGMAVLVPVLGAAAVIAAGLGSAPGVPRMLSTKPMTKIGDISYSWYLWHWPLIVFGALLWPGEPWVLAVIGLLSIIPAWLSTTYLEDPIRKNKRIRGWRVVAVAAVCTIVPTAACVGLWVGADSSWGNKAVAQMKEAVEEVHAGAKAGCDDSATESSIDEEGCQFNKSARGPHVYLVGNSVADMYAEALIGASENLDVPLTIDTTTGCFFNGDKGNRECSDTFTNTMNKLMNRVPGIVVMSSTWDLGLQGGTEGPIKKAIKERRDLLIAGLTDSVNKLRDHGHQVLLVLPTPRFFNGPEYGEYLAVPDPNLPRSEAHSSSWRPQDCPGTLASADPSACGATVPQEEEDTAQQPTIKAIEKVAKLANAYTLNLRDRYCWGGLCRTNDGDRWMFEDGIHISVGESQALSSTFTDALRDILREHWVMSDDKKKNKKDQSQDKSANDASSTDESPDPEASP